MQVFYSPVTKWEGKRIRNEQQRDIKATYFCFVLFSFLICCGYLHFARISQFILSCRLKLKRMNKDILSRKRYLRISNIYVIYICVCVINKIFALTLFEECLLYKWLLKLNNPNLEGLLCRMLYKSKYYYI